MHHPHIHPLLYQTLPSLTQNNVLQKDTILQYLNGIQNRSHRKQNSQVKQNISHEKYIQLHKVTLCKLEVMALVACAELKQSLTNYCDSSKLNQNKSEQAIAQSRMNQG